MAQEMTVMEKIVSLAKRRGFIYQGSEIYGGLAGTYDYGPLGSLLKNNIRDSWVRTFVHSREDIYLLDAAILMNARVWEATGHTKEFIDPLVEDLKTHKRYRADHLLEEAGVEAAGLSIEAMSAAIRDNAIKSPDGNPLGDVRAFNMMLETRVGAAVDTSAISYLRPETAQGIFVNYKNVIDSMHPKLPFGIAQVGKAFRNEITPRDFTFRLRELEQMEIEYFIRPDIDWEPLFEEWLELQKGWLAAVGVDVAKLRQYEHPDAARSHYSKKTVDWEFAFPFGTKELTGLAHRTDFDLSRHAAASGVRLDYLDESTGDRFVPHVLEPTVGLDRAVLATLCSAYSTDEMGDGEREYLKLAPSVAPVRAAVFPLLKNKPELVGKAREVYSRLKQEISNVAFDDNGNIGKRYRRQDEIGTPHCITIDFDTLGETPEHKDTVTLRDRDSGSQERVHVDELLSLLRTAH